MNESTQIPVMSWDSLALLPAIDRMLREERARVMKINRMRNLTPAQRAMMHVERVQNVRALECARRLAVYFKQEQERGT